ncbi:MAG: leucine-rich repeat protein [Muribaculaceae bacterium]|nr:leucine-rich repeat protein [Muribaculaceae bacterium]
MKRFLTLLITCSAAFTIWAVQVDNTAGNLANLIDDTSITQLTVTGTIDARDFKFIADELNNLVLLNLSNAHIVAYSNANSPVFMSVTNYEENTIPTTAFMGKKLRSVTLPTSTRTIGKAAFAGCNQLEDLILPQELEVIEPYAFSACNKLNSINLPTGLKELGEGAFSRCNGLKTITINPTNDLVVEKDAFIDCIELACVNLGEKVTEIGPGAFAGCTSLKSPNFNDNNNITIIAEAAFIGSGIENINLDNSNYLTTIGMWAFANTPLNNITLPSSLVSLGDGAFFYNHDMSQIDIPAGITSLSNYLLAGNNATNIDQSLKDGIKTIGDYALYNSSATSLTLPSSIEHIGKQAMAGMISLQELTSNAVEVPELGENVWLGVNQAIIPLVVPRESYNAYKAAEQWKEFLVSLPPSVYGDVNQDGVVTATDITALYNYLLNGDETYFATSDVDGDGVVSAADITCIYNILLGNKNTQGRNKSVHNDNDKLVAQGFTLEAGNSHTMDVELINTASISAIQLDLIMPQGLSITDVITSDRATGMLMGYNEIEPGKWRILLTNATAMKGNEGTLFNITVQADDSFGGNNTITINNIIAVEPTELIHFISDLTVEVGNTTGVKDINFDSHGPVDVYNMNGQLLRHNVERNEATQGLPSGIYIVGGKKVIVR